eukprot:37997-Eustigmatos_ZCMA.PRE.1
MVPTVDCSLPLTQYVAQVRPASRSAWSSHTRGVHVHMLRDFHTNTTTGRAGRALTPGPWAWVR